MKDALYNLAPKSGANDAYCQGLIVGVVSALMAMGMPFNEALSQTVKNVPDDTRRLRHVFPESWMDDVNTIANKIHTQLKSR